MWDWAIWIAGAVYLAMVLFLNLYSPAFGVVLIVLAGYEVVEPRCRRPRFDQRAASRSITISANVPGNTGGLPLPSAGPNFAHTMNTR